MPDLLPVTVRIGALAYAVVEVDDLEAEDGEKLLGHILHNHCEIRIDRALPDQVKVAVLWHEIIHGILEQAGVTNQKEGLVLALGYGMVELLKDNPGLAEFVDA